MASSWMKGYSSEWLRALAQPFKAYYAPHIHGAFGLPKERDIALALSKDEIIWTMSGDTVAAVAIFRVASQGSLQRDFCQRRIKIHKGDLFVRHLTGPSTSMEAVLDALLSRAGPRPVWLELHAERPTSIQIARDRGFSRVATKISAASDIRTLYLRGDDPDTRVSRSMSSSDEVGLVILDETFVSSGELAQVQGDIDALTIWEQHYSGYNKRSSWSALALRGFVPSDPTFIVKPSEMSKKWKSSNAALLKATCADTPLSTELRRVMDVVDRVPGVKERVRLMRLSSINGELTRHADITDRDAGTLDGMISRLHVPIQTNKECMFKVWDEDGTSEALHLPSGSLSYLDVRKPHAVLNRGTSDRIHLVIDVQSSPALRSLICG